MGCSPLAYRDLSDKNSGKVMRQAGDVVFVSSSLGGFDGVLSGRFAVRRCVGPGQSAFPLCKKPQQSLVALHVLFLCCESLRLPFCLLTMGM
jgi:hypothetical protein